MVLANRAEDVARETFERSVGRDQSRLIMLVIDLTDRHSARKCYQAAVKIPLHPKDVLSHQLQYPMLDKYKIQGFGFGECCLQTNFVGSPVPTSNL